MKKHRTVVCHTKPLLTCELESSLIYITDEKDSRAKMDTKIKSPVLATIVSLSSILRLT